MDRLGVAVFRSAPDGTLLDANPAWLSLFGFSSLEEAQRVELPDLYVDPADRTALIASLLATGEVRDLVLRLRAVDGRELWVSAAEVATTLGDGNVVIDGVLVETGERVAAARAVAREAEQFRTLIEKANVAIFLGDAETGKLIHANGKAQELIGRSLTEIRGMHQRDLHPADATPVYEGIFLEHATAAESPHVNGEVIDGAGNRIPVSISASVVELEGRRVVQGIFYDMRGMYRARQALEESAHRYRQLVELSPDAIAVHADGQIVFVNQQAIRMLGASNADELIGRSVLAVVHPDSLPTVQQRVSRMLETGEPEPLLEERFVRLDGTPLEVEVAAGPFTYEGQPAIQVVFRDIGERRRMRAELERSQAHQAAILAGLPVAIYVAEVPSPQDMTWVSESIERFTGFPARHFVERADFWSSRIHPEDRDRVLGVFRSEISAGEVRVEYRWRIAEGRYRWLAEHARVVACRGGVTEIIGTIADVSEQREAERALRESEEKYRALVEDVLEIIFGVDDSGVLTFVSPAIERVTGFAVAEVQGRHFSEFIWPEDAPELEASFGKVLSGDLHPSEYRVMHRGGGYRWVRSSSRPILEEGRVVGLRGVMVDITDRREAEDALQRSATRLKAMHEVDLAILAARSVREIAASALRTLRQQIGAERASIIVFDPATGEGEYVAVDAEPELGDEVGSTLPLADFEARELRGGETIYYPDLSASPELPPIGRALLARGVSSLLICSFDIQKGVVARLALSNRRADVFSAEHREMAGEVAGVLGVALSQTRLRERIEEQQRTLALLVAQLPDGIVVLTEDGHLALANPAAVDYLDMLGHRDVRAPVVALAGVPLQEILASRPVGLPQELATEGPDVRLFEVRARATVGGPEHAWILLIHDATRERQMERSLEQQDRLAVIGHLAGGLAHDFNNYLTAILTHAELLLRDATQSPAAREALRVIKEQSERSAKLVRSILDFSRGSESERRRLDLGLFVSELAQILTRTIPERILIDVAVDPVKECLVLADATQLQQVIMNVAVNARDAMPGQGELRLRVACEELAEGETPPAAGMGSGAWVHLSIEDTGTGILPDHLPHVFEPFFTTKPTGHGTGLGLSQAYGLIRQHEGFMTVKSQAGEGTTVDIFLPRQDEGSASARPPEPQPEDGHGELIVLAEDEAEVRGAITQALEMLGYRVVAVEDGQRALTYLREVGGADLLLTDLTMPVMSGDELVRLAHQELPGLPIVVLTGYAAGRLTVLREQGVVTTVQKPLSMVELAHVVRDALR
jgi:two-component system, cell cycle sensor histidine kinase and response regulator CckA